MKVIADLLSTTVSHRLTAPLHHQELLSRGQAFCNNTVQFTEDMDYHKNIIFFERENFCYILSKRICIKECLEQRK
jgi:hypothetical protein